MRVSFTLGPSPSIVLLLPYQQQIHNNYVFAVDTVMIPLSIEGEGPRVRSTIDLSQVDDEDFCI
jgi:hypothetical protein